MHSKADVPPAVTRDSSTVRCDDRGVCRIWPGIPRWPRLHLLEAASHPRRSGDSDGADALNLARTLSLSFHVKRRSHGTLTSRDHAAING